MATPRSGVHDAKKQVRRLLSQDCVELVWFEQFDKACLSAQQHSSHQVLQYDLDTRDKDLRYWQAYCVRVQFAPIDTENAVHRAVHVPSRPFEESFPTGQPRVSTSFLVNGLPFKQAPTPTSSGPAATGASINGTAITQMLWLQCIALSSPTYFVDSEAVCQVCQARQGLLRSLCAAVRVLAYACAAYICACACAAAHLYGAQVRVDYDRQCDIADAPSRTVASVSPRSFAAAVQTSSFVARKRGFANCDKCATGMAADALASQQYSSGCDVNRSRRMHNEEGETVHCSQRNQH